MGKLQPGVNDLETWCKKNGREDLLQEWDYEKNEVKKPSDYAYGSGQKVWWICKNGHEWQDTITHRVHKRNCPVCSNKQVLLGYNDLATTNPELAKEWHATKNSVLLPTEVTRSSGKKVWWKCHKCGYEWQTYVYSRNAGCGCPKCADKERKNKAIINKIQKVGSLESRYPLIAQEWNYNKNNKMTPANVLSNSNKKVWWKCKKGHEWQAVINSRASGNGCPICSGHQVLAGFNDLATANPKLAAEWHPTKNGDLRPSMVTACSGKKVWWLGKCGHEWQAVIGSRMSGTGCPYCSHQKLLVGFNDFATEHQELLDEWDNEKNSCKPNELMSHSRYNAWWKCPFGHSYQTYLSNRCRAVSSGCPICDKENHTSFPEQALFFYIKKLYPDAINSDRVAIGMELDIYVPSLRIGIEYDGKNWHKNNKHELKKNKACKDNGILLVRIREEGLELYDDCHCIVRRNVESNDSLSDVIKKVIHDMGNYSRIDIDVDRDSALIYNSYITARKSQSLKNTYPEIAKEWHPTKNSNLTSEMVAPFSGKKVWWLGKCGHEWQSTVSNRVHGNGCPYCSNQKVLTGFNDLATTDPELAKQWSFEKNGNLTPRMITRGSHKKIWWNCSEGHEWQAAVYNRINGYGCPYCAGQKTIKGRNDLATTNPELAKEWHPTKNGDLLPCDVKEHSNKKAWWICSKGHEWQAVISSRAAGSGCPYCSGQRHLNIQCVETNKIFNNYNEAAKFCNLSGGTHISACCRGKEKTAGGYHWKFYEEEGEENDE